jgi:putative membrane protein
MAIALWLAALGAFVVLPIRRAADGGRSGRGPIETTASAGAIVVAGGFLMVAGIRFGAAVDIARPIELLLVTVLAGVTFAALVGALVALFGNRGWLVALLSLPLQVAAAGFPYPVSAMPWPIALASPFLPLTWAADAMRGAVSGLGGSPAVAVAVLVAWFIGGVLVALAAEARSRPARAWSVQ